MQVGDWVEAHNANHGWRGVVVDYEPGEGFVTLDQTERWTRNATVKTGYPVTLVEAAYEWIPARFSGSIDGGAY